ncbi:sulfatase-like hydrolase/transferase [Falsibacillus pallidus]|uniref:sulfatase-like hydrolase/transferase n=1 Tax=Falsibacillus pallidus TaxID=493781 RepID=UPI003D99C788
MGKDHFNKKKPNFLILMVDEERYPSVYETPKLKEWREKNLIAQELIKDNGFQFLNHYIGSTACSPSRTTLYTGQYPSLHGVTQTSGAAKGSFDPDMFWLDHSTVPTMGDYFRTAGYRTFWKGKWHASDEDIIIPGTTNPYLSYNNLGVPVSEKVEVYRDADRLEEYGFCGWIGPEPHGPAARNSGSSAAFGVSGRDVVYATETVELIQELENEAHSGNSSPWLVMCSFVNPHDIALYGAFAKISPTFNFEVDPSVPYIPKAPTAEESLETKPRAQRSYREVYPKAFQPLRDTLFYRQLYYSLQKKVDQEMLKVFEALKTSSFYEDTIVIFLSDHGDMLGAHGGLFQKWYNTYEESIHVPFIMHNPKLFSGRESTTMLTSHVDVLPTMLGLAGIDVKDAQKELAQNHTEVRPLVGRNLAPLLKGRTDFFRANEPLYFMSDDDVTKGPNQFTVTGQPYHSVVQPNHTEAIITTLPTGENRKKETWKLTRYFDNPKFWTNPGVSDVTTTEGAAINTNDHVSVAISVTTTKTSPVPEEYEMYNLSIDPMEERNLIFPEYSTSETEEIQRVLTAALAEQRKQKRLEPEGD